MNNFEQNLRRALQRQDPPAGFADRVLARAKQGSQEKSARQTIWAALDSWGGLRWATACALCVLLAASGALYEHDIQQRRGEAAKEQLMLALRITGSKLQIAQQSLEQIGATGEQGR